MMLGALVIEELDCLGVPERVDALPGVGSADHVDHAVDRDSAVGVGDAGALAAALGAALGEDRDGFWVGWLGGRCGVPCLLRGDPEFFEKPDPARTTVSAALGPGMKVEIDAIAVLAG